MPAVYDRRWSYSLRTLFAGVTLIACWLGYAVPWIKQRHAFLAQPYVISEFNDPPPLVFNRWGNTWPVFAPDGLWLLGERGLVSVWLAPEIWSPQRQHEAARLFPEARLLKVKDGRWDPGP
jgi:hypothetical protein